MPNKVVQWLERLGLAEYAEAFEENAIDLAHLPDLDHEALKEIGVGPVGHRLTILKAASITADGAPLVTDSSPGEAERRQLSVMFCDLVGSTALSTRLDPEIYRDVLSAYQDTVRRAIKRYGGYIARYMGDGLLVYFGYPQAHEDDPERAVRAGLEVANTVKHLDVGLPDPLAVRVGIATGLVVAGDIIGEGASEERAVLGETPNLAARLQGLADLDSVIISDTTRRLVRGRFELESFGLRKLKGIDGAVPVFKATGVRETSRFEAGAHGPVAELSGRDREMSLLWQRWEQVQGGNGAAVVVSGEPGIGKSRLVQELTQGAQAGTVLRYQCSPYYTGSAFHPFVVQVQRAAGLRPENSPAEQVDKLSTLLADGTASSGDVQLALFASLLAVSPEAMPPLDMSPQRQRAETIAALGDYLEQSAARGTALVVFEDLHWIDPSSQEVLAQFFTRIQAFPILALMTHRPGYMPPWSNSEAVFTLNLNRLGENDALAVIGQVTLGKPLPTELVTRILARTDGVPLFVEELTKNVIESGLVREMADRFELVGSAESLSIPETLRDSLVARLDRLGAVKSVAQSAACIGREFSRDLLEAVTELDRNTLEGALQQLEDGGLVFRSASEPTTLYSFKHALVQDAASDSLLTSTRRRIHSRIVEALETGGVDEIEPERIASHCTLAGETETAIAYLRKAALNALATSSLPEANAHLSSALKLIADIADEHAQQEHELEVRTLLGSATMALLGWPSPVAREVIEPACALFEKGVGDAKAFINFWNLWVHHGCRGEHDKGLSVVRQMLAHASSHGGHVSRLVSSFAASMAHLWVGNYVRAEEFERAALDSYDFDTDHRLVWQYNHDPKNTLLSWGSQRIWARGSPDQARRLSDDAVAHAREVGHPFNLCWTLGNSSFVYANCGDLEPAEARIIELGKIAHQEGLDFIEAYMVPANRCVHAVCQGDFELAYAEAERAEAVWSAIGGRFWSPVVRSCMARSAAELGRPDEARDVIGRAIDQIETTGERMYAEDVYRTAGLIHADIGDDDGALQFYERSLQYARQHGTLSFELRTAMALAELWQRNARSEEASTLLGSLYAKFDEGLETTDLRAARRLLAELAS